MKPRSEREAIRREMNRMGMMGRSGDWMSCLPPVGLAKVYKLMAEDSRRASYEGHLEEAARFEAAATDSWPDVTEWTGRKDDPMVKHPELYR